MKLLFDQQLSFKLSGYAVATNQRQSLKAYSEPTTKISKHLAKMIRYAGARSTQLPGADSSPALTSRLEFVTFSAPSGIGSPAWRGAGQGHRETTPQV